MTTSCSIRRFLATALLVPVVCIAYAAAATAQDLRSPALAKELSKLMTAAKLDVIALQDPDTPDGFVAAMLIPDVQLIMVTSRHSTPDYLKRTIAEKQYQEAYALLQQSDKPATRLYFQDLGVDGLPPHGSENVDIMFEGTTQTMFGGKNGNPDMKKLLDADARYSRLLQLTIDVVRTFVTDATPLATAKF